MLFTVSNGYTFSCLVYSITSSVLLISYISQNALEQHQGKGHELAACSHSFPVQKLKMQHVTKSIVNLTYLLPLCRISSHMLVKCQCNMLRLKSKPRSLILRGDIKCDLFSDVLEQWKVPHCSCTGDISSYLLNTTEEKTYHQTTRCLLISEVCKVENKPFQVLRVFFM